MRCPNWRKNFVLIFGSFLKNRVGPRFFHAGIIENMSMLPLARSKFQVAKLGSHKPFFLLFGLRVSKSAPVGCRYYALIFCSKMRCPVRLEINYFVEAQSKFGRAPTFLYYALWDAGWFRLFASKTRCLNKFFF